MLWLAAAALADDAPTNADDPVLAAIVLLDRGDRAWFTGHRREGARAWRKVLKLDPPPALDAMVRLRLLRAGTNWSMFTHGTALGRSLRSCADDDVWCDLAIADFHLLSSPALGAKPEEGLLLAEQLVDVLPQRAATRLALAGRALPGNDGLGKALEDGFVMDRGPSLFSFGAVGGPSTGPGVNVFLVHPDVFRKDWYLRGDAFVATNGAGITGALGTRGRISSELSGSVRRFRWFDGDDWIPVTTAVIQPGMAAAAKRLVVRAGPVARWDVDPTIDGTAQGHGLWMGWGVSGGEVQRKGWQLQTRGEWSLPTFGDYERLGVLGALTGYLPMPVGTGVIASRLRSEAAFGDMPEIRVPTVGGPFVHRGAFPGQLRDSRTVTFDLELRQRILPWLWVAAWGDVAEVDGIHPGGGGGVRFDLPPRPHNRIRLDFGVTDTGNAFYVSFGEAF